MTVFTGRPDEYPVPMERWDALCGFVPGDEVHVARRAEDRAALEVLAPTTCGSVSSSTPTSNATRWVRAEHVVDELTEAVRALDPTVVFAPFGLANPDHDCTHDAAMLVRERLADDGAAAGRDGRRGSATRTPVTSTSRACSRGASRSCSAGALADAGGGRRSTSTTSASCAAWRATRRSSSRSSPTGRSRPSSRPPRPSSTGASRPRPAGWGALSKM